MNFAQKNSAQKMLDQAAQHGAAPAPERAPDLPISFPSGKRWYVVYTNIKCEFRAEKGLRAKGYDVFLPRAKLWIRHARRKKERVVPLLPRYLFVGFDINLMPWYEIRNTDGVEGVLSNNSIPVPIPAAAIDDLRAMQEIGVFDETTEVLRLKEGDPVRMVKGPFAGHFCTLKSARGKKRVEVILSLFGRENVLCVPLSALRPG
jgi:transcriptional antiterminator RfaH